MRRYRREFGRFVNSVAGDFGNANAIGANAPDPNFRANVAWAICLLVVILGTIALVIFSHGQALQLIIAVLWGVFLGLTLLFYLPQKLLITIIGGVVGSGLTNLSDIVDKLKNFAAAAKEINDVLNGIFGSQLAIQNGAVFIFMFLVILCCLPAYRGQDS